MPEIDTLDIMQPPYQMDEMLMTYSIYSCSSYYCHHDVFNEYRWYLKMKSIFPLWTRRILGICKDTSS